MAAPALSAPAPVLAVVDGTPTTTSVDVARQFGKQHLHVMERIRALIPELPEKHQSDFRLVDYIDAKGENRPAYELNRDGFVVLAMGFTGKKALGFKLAYIDAFNRMEAALHTPAALAAPKPGHALKALQMAGAVASRVQQQVFAALMAGTDADALLHGRWLVHLDHKHKAQVCEVAPDALVGSYADIARNIATNSLGASGDDLAALAAACLAELAHRRGHAQPAALASLPAAVRPLFEVAVARLCTDAHATISTWALGKLAYDCNLNHPDRLHERASKALDALRFDDWLSHGAAAQARALLTLFGLAGQMAAESASRMKAAIDKQASPTTQALTQGAQP